MPNTCPALLVRVAEAHRVRAVLEIDADADQPGHTRRDRLFDHLGGIAQLLEVQVGVDEDVAYSSSMSSRRLKSASGAGSLRPASSCEGRQRSTASYSPVITVCELPSSANWR